MHLAHTRMRPDSAASLTFVWWFRSALSILDVHTEVPNNAVGRQVREAVSHRSVSNIRLHHGRGPAFSSSLILFISLYVGRRPSRAISASTSPAAETLQTRCLA